MFSAAPGEFHAVQQKQILLRPIAGNGEIVAVVELETPVPPVFSRGEIHDSGIQRQQQVIAAPVERQVFHLLLSHQSGNILGGDADQRSVALHRNLLAHGAYVQRQVDGTLFIDDHADSRAHFRGKALLRRSDFVWPQWQRRETIVAAGVGGRFALRRGVGIFRDHRRARNRRAGFIRDDSTNRPRDLCRRRRNPQ